MRALVSFNSERILAASFNTPLLRCGHQGLEKTSPLGACARPAGSGLAAQEVEGPGEARPGWSPSSPSHAGVPEPLDARSIQAAFSLDKWTPAHLAALQTRRGAEGTLGTHWKPGEVNQKERIGGNIQWKL